jgi:hypothetical protein
MQSKSEKGGTSDPFSAPGYLLLERVREGTMNLNNLIASMRFTTAVKIWAYNSSELLAEG